MNRQTVDFNVKNAASDVDVIRCTDDCFDVNTLLHSVSSRSDEKQLMSKSLHLIAMRLNALTIENDIRHVAFNRETIKCTLTIVWKSCQDCIWCRCHQMHWRLFVDVREAASDFEQSNALTKLSVDVKWLHLTLNDQMHWRSYLIVKLLHLIVKRPNARWRLSVVKICWSDVFRDETSKIAFDAEIVKCIDNFLLCLLSNWKTNKLLIDDANETSKMKSMCCIWCQCHQMQWQLFKFSKNSNSTIV